MGLRLATALLLLVALTTTLGAQGIPGTRANIAGRRGWDAIRDGRNEEAAAAFAEALRAESRDGSLYLGAGMAAHLLGRPAEARSALEQALTLAPNLTAASLLLGDILYRDNELDAALDVFEAARQYAPRDAALAARIEQTRAEATVHRDFFQSHGAHFTILFEGPADAVLAQRALDILEDAYFRIGTALNTFPERPIAVVLYTEQQFRDVTRSPQWAAAAFDGRIRVPMRGALAQSDELERVLAHEFTHALVRTIAPRGVPTWLNEGLAVLFEPAGREWSAETLGRVRRRIPLSQLGDGFGRLADGDARIAYAQSGDAVRELLDQAGSTAVVALLQDIGRGRPFADAFVERTLVPYESFAARVGASN